MSDFLIYNMKAGAILLVFTAVYLLLFEKERYFYINRIYILFCLFFAAVVPAMNFESSAYIPENVTAVSAKVNNIIIISPETSTTFGFYDFINVIFVIGCCISGIMFMIRLVQIFKLVKSNSFSKINRYFIAYNNALSNSFSFGNRIIIGTKDHKADEIAMILSHEKVHVQHFHTIDLIIAEFIMIFQWFNPAIYLIKRFLTTNHEFTADNIISKNNSLSDYMKLISKNSHKKYFTVVNSFYNVSIIRKRFEMLTQNKRRSLRLIKYFMVLPVSALIFIVTACSENDGEFDASTAYTIEDFQNLDIGEQNHFARFNGNVRGYINENIEYPKEAAEKGVLAKLQFDILIDEKGNIEGVKHTGSKFIIEQERSEFEDIFISKAKTLIMNMPQWQPAIKDGKPAKYVEQIGIVFGDQKRWMQLNPADKIESDMLDIDHLYFPDLMNHIINNVKYPLAARKDNITATVLLDIDINKIGKIIRAESISFSMERDGKHIESTDTYGFIDEAIRVVMDSPVLPNAVNKNGEPVAVNFKIPIKFQLN